MLLVGFQPPNFYFYLEESFFVYGTLGMCLAWATWRESSLLKHKIWNLFLTTSQEPSVFLGKKY